MNMPYVNGKGKELPEKLEGIAKFPRLEIHELDRLAVSYRGSEIFSPTKDVPRPIIYPQGSDADHVCLIRSGRVGTYYNSRNGNGTLIDMLTAGSWLGLSVLHSEAENPPHQIEAQALRESEILYFDRTEFKDAKPYIPQLGVAVEKDLGQKVASSYERAIQRTVLERVVFFLVRYGKEFGTDYVGGEGILVDIRNTELAEFLGARPETITRNKGKLKRLGMIEGGYGEVIIPDWNELVEYAKNLGITTPS